jgi:hypothetical protein
MDEETKILLKEEVEIAKENNHMLKVLIRGHKINMISRAVYWTFIILSFIGAGYFLKSVLPSMSGILDAYGGMEQGSSVEDLKQTQRELLESLNR